MKCIFLPLFLFVTTSGWAKEQNYAASYFQTAELQLETKTQCREIKAALNDMLQKKPTALKSKRYKDYEGKSDSWSLAELLGHYFVPVPPVGPDEKKLFESYRSKLAKKYINRTLARLGDCNGYVND